MSGKYIELLPAAHVRTLAASDLALPLAELGGILPQVLVNGIQQGWAARASVTKHHFDFERGRRERADRLASIISQLASDGAAKLPSIHGVLLPCQRRVLTTVRGDRFTGSEGPTPPRPLNRTGLAVLRQMTQLVERNNAARRPMQLVTDELEFWMLLVRGFEEQGYIAAEVARPCVVDGAHIVGFDLRIRLPSIEIARIKVGRRPTATRPRATPAADVQVRRRRKT